MEEKSLPLEKETSVFTLYGLVFEVGYTIAIPLVAFAFIGRLLDKRLETTPWLLLGGIVISVFVSSFIVYKKVSKIIT